jgi:3-phosphoshikimate 1-carboxyvinyltransferase
LGRSSRARSKGVGGPFPVKKADLSSATPAPLSSAHRGARVFGGEYRLSGVPRMHERPIGDLVDALRGIGARIDYTGSDGFPPLAIHPGKIAARSCRCGATCPRSSSPRC